MAGPDGEDCAMPSSETMELRRLVGKFALLFADAYVLVLVLVLAGFVITLVQHVSTPRITWPLIIIPVAAFIPAVIDAINLHRISDADQTNQLWRRRGLLTLIGAVLVAVAEVVLNRMNS